MSLIKQQYHHGDLRGELIREAARILREAGEDGLSMRKLAARVGVSRTAPYHHFPDKQKLLCAIAEEGFNSMNHYLETAGREAADFREYIERVLSDYVNFAVDNADYYDLMFSSRIWKSGKIDNALRESAHRTFHRYLKDLSTFVSEDMLPRGVSLIGFAQSTWSTFHGLSRLLIDGIYVEREAVDAICRSAIALVIVSLRSN